mgnify:CR=1 FL=1|jgi:hypothetical protein
MIQTLHNIHRPDIIEKQETRGAKVFALSFCSFSYISLDELEDERCLLSSFVNQLSVMGQIEF